ncbi:MAG TPA: RMD1 family protein [Hyphomicrobiaceae bacterium]|nr:RMD1 family protein [Hyphomicrobiaceae bacterium]
MSTSSIIAHALQLAERIDLKGLERPDQFSSNPLAFKVASGGTVVLFRFGAAVFIGMNPLEEDGIVKGLDGRLIDPLVERETETAHILLKADGEDQPLPNGAICLKNDAPERLLLLAEALAMSVAFAYDERRITQAFDQVVPIASSLKQRKLLRGSQGNLVEQIGEALLIQQRLAGRVELADRPDVLWDHPDLERLWVKLTDEYDLGPRARAVGQKLEVIRETADTMADLLSTRTSHRLEWYIIGLICLELLLGLFNRVFK